MAKNGVVVIACLKESLHLFIYLFIYLFFFLGGAMGGEVNIEKIF